MPNPELINACFILSPEDQSLLEDLSNLTVINQGSSKFAHHDQATGLQITTTGDLIILTGLPNAIETAQQLLTDYDILGPHNPLQIADLETVYPSN